MPANRNALLRYRTLDRCLRNFGRRWTLDDLIAAVSDALYEYEGRQVDVSRRTVQLDLQTMRSDKLGYNAPIEVYDRKYYRYADREFAITDSPLSEQDLSRLREVVDTLRQFTGFRQMETFGGLVGRLRDQLGAGRAGGRRIIDFEHNEQLRGLHWIDPLYEIIAAGHVLEVSYRSFRSRRAKTYVLEPHFLKESRNRFFVLGYVEGTEQVIIMALDRIEEVLDTGRVFERRSGLEPDTYFEHTVGVSVSEAPPEEVRLRLSVQRAPYVLTKPIHRSQRVVRRTDRYVEVALYVQHSFELESELLALGEDAQVLAPERLRQRMRQVAEASAAAYDQPFTPAEFAHAAERFRKTGYLRLDRLLSLRETKGLRAGVRHLQRQPSLFAETAGEQCVEITELLPPRTRGSLSSAVGHELAALGLRDERPDQVFLYRSDPVEESTFGPCAGRKLLVCLTRWRNGARGLECRLGELAVGFDAGYGQAVLAQAGVPIRVRSQRRQVFWWLEVVWA